MVERWRTDVGASQDCRFSAGQRRHRQGAPDWEVNWSAYQTRVNEDESGRVAHPFSLASSSSIRVGLFRPRPFQSPAGEGVLPFAESAVLVFALGAKD